MQAQLLCFLEVPPAHRVAEGLALGGLDVAELDTAILYLGPIHLVVVRDVHAVQLRHMRKVEVCSRQGNQDNNCDDGWEYALFHVFLICKRKAEWVSGFSSWCF